MNPLSTVIEKPSNPLTLLERVILLTAAIDANASPRNPLVTIVLKSSEEEILLVACLFIANFSSFLGIPWPSSITEILENPPFTISILIFPQPESIEFSTNSLTT